MQIALVGLSLTKYFVIKELWMKESRDIRYGGYNEFFYGRPISSMGCEVV
jgi:hypothetical protein